MTNDWIEVAPNAMPKMGETVWAVRHREEGVELVYFIDFEDLMEFENGIYSHFQRITEPKPPSKLLAANGGGD